MARPNSFASIVKPWIIDYYRKNRVLPKAKEVLRAFKDDARVTPDKSRRISNIISDLKLKLKGNKHALDPTPVKIEKTPDEELEGLGEVDRSLKNRLSQVRQMADQCADAAQAGRPDHHGYEKLVKLEVALAEKIEKRKLTQDDKSKKATLITMEVAMQTYGDGSDSE